MYTRGQFAIMGNVGRKALRLYHEEGLLVPVYVNESNGYHYYNESQLETLERIKRYRKLRLSLFEIKQILDGRASETDIIESKINETDRLLSEMKGYRQVSDPDDAAPTDQIDIRPFERCRCVYVCENTDREELGMSVGRLYERASREGLKASGDHFAVYDGAENGDSFSMMTCLPVSDCTADDLLEVYEEKCLHIKFRDGFSNLWKAHRMLAKYAEDNGISASGRIYEVYRRDMSADVYYAVKD
ncbi:MAG: MerR family transcriptional regulator [Ruminococcus sp.]|nr:MerR family transcriptional regulator [Ruminococcus sp.]